MSSEDLKTCESIQKKVEDIRDTNPTVYPELTDQEEKFLLNSQVIQEAWEDFKNPKELFKRVPEQLIEHT